MKEFELPKGWAETTLGEIAKWGSGGTPKSTVREYYGGDIPWLVIGDLNDSYIITANTYITESGLKNSSAKIIKPNSVLLAMYGSIGKLGINKVPLASNQAITFTQKLYDGVYNLYLFYYLLSVRSKLHSLGKGGTQKNISQTVIKAVKFPLPPLPEQHRIVEKIETLFSELDSGVESLKAAKAQLKRYRQSVLKSAFDGKLTEAWRREHADELESAESLLERIKAEREAAYEKKLDEWKEAVKAWEANGKEGKKPVKPRKVKELSSEDNEEAQVLPILPEFWQYEYLGNLNVEIFDGPFGSNLKSSDYVDNGVRVIRLENIGNLEFIDEKKSFVTEKKYDSLKKHTVQGGDIIFSSFIANDTRVVKLPIHINKAINKADCFCVRVTNELIDVNFLELFLASKNTYSQLEVQVHGATRPRINTTQLASCKIPVTSIQEQHQIVNEIESRLSEADATENAIDESLQKAERLRQSILKKAFEGKLVPQDENDESASELLNRIKAGKS